MERNTLRRTEPRGPGVSHQRGTSTICSRRSGGGFAHYQAEAGGSTRFTSNRAIRSRPRRWPRRNAGCTISELFARVRRRGAESGWRRRPQVCPLPGGRGAPLLDHRWRRRGNCAYRRQHGAGRSHRSLIGPPPGSARASHSTSAASMLSVSGAHDHPPQPPFDAAKTCGSRLPDSAAIWQPRLRYRFFRPLRRFARCPDLRRKARGVCGAGYPTAYQADHPVLPLRLSQRHGEQSQNRPAAGAAVFANGTHWDFFGQPGAGPPGRPGGRA